MRADTFRVRRALLSVSDKRGVTELAAGLAELGVELISTGGTAEALTRVGLKATPVEAVTGSPEMLGGRVKTLHPAVHGGILARRERPGDMARLTELGIGAIDMVVVNLYPFTETISRPEATVEDALEQIDIGGPALLRAAAKNFTDVLALCDPDDYAGILEMLRAGGGCADLETRAGLAAKAFAHTAGYDSAVAAYLASVSCEEGRPVARPEKFPQRFSIHLGKVCDLRYGENPHQGAALYREEGRRDGSLIEAEQLQGKQLSFNNYTDLEGARQLASEFAAGRPFCAVIKHANPCGAALAGSAAEAFAAALSTDPVSAFGGIVAFNCEVDAAAASGLTGLFLECIVAPAYSGEALAILGRKKNLRVLRCPLPARPEGFDMQRISGGLLLQDYDWDFIPPEQWRVVTARQPNHDELAAMDFAWRVCKHVKSNAIVFAGPGRLYGVGAGQMSRVDSVRIAAARFDRNAVERPIVLASDAFFPFSDGLEAGADAGATAVVQPGGSKRDDEVITAADTRGVAMVFTGRRHFRH